MKLFDFAILAWLLNRHARQTMPLERLEALEAAEAAEAARKKAERFSLNNPADAFSFICLIITMLIYYWIGFNLIYTIFIFLGTITAFCTYILFFSFEHFEDETIDTITGVFICAMIGVFGGMVLSCLVWLCS